MNLFNTCSSPRRARFTSRRPAGVDPSGGSSDDVGRAIATSEGAHEVAEFRRVSERSSVVRRGRLAAAAQRFQAGAGWGIVSPLITHYPSLSGIGQTCPDLAIAIFSGGEARTRLREIVMQNRSESPFLRVLPIESPNQSLAAMLDLASYMKIRSRNSALSRVRSATCARIWRKPKAGSR